MRVILRGYTTKGHFPESWLGKALIPGAWCIFKKAAIDKVGLGGKDQILWSFMSQTKKFRLYPQGHGVSLEGFKKGSDMSF